MKRKVLIVEPSEVIVEGLKSTLHHADLRILDTETQVDELSERLDLLKPDILIINPTLYDNVTELRNGRNVAVVIEVAARNHSLKQNGYSAAQELDRRLNEMMMNSMGK